VIEPLPWAGNPKQPIDRTNLGKYFFEVVDAAERYHALLARVQLDLRRVGNDRRSTEDQPDVSPSRCAFRTRQSPLGSLIRKRDAKNAFQDIWTLTVDPADKFIERGAAAANAGALLKLHERGDPATKLDLLILGDGYTAAERGKFERDARRLVDVLFSISPFKERQRDINVWGLSPPSAQSGSVVPRSTSSSARRSAPRTTRSTPSATSDLRQSRVSRHRRPGALRRRRDPDQHRRRTGGGGIFGLYSTVAADSAWAPVQSSSTSSAITSRPSPTSTTRPTWRICPPTIASSRGSRT
jgi:hypothetical protein